MWEGLASLFNNTLGSNGIGGAIGSMFTPSVAAIPAANLGDAMNSGTLMFDEATNSFSDGVKNYSMSEAGDLYSAGGSDGGLASMASGAWDAGKGILSSLTPSKETQGLISMLGTGAKAYSDINTSNSVEEVNDMKIRLAKEADQRTKDGIAQSKRIWG